jgi:hypothetical protein
MLLIWDYEDDDDHEYHDDNDDDSAALKLGYLCLEESTLCSLCSDLLVES